MNSDEASKLFGSALGCLLQDHEGIIIKDRDTDKFYIVANLDNYIVIDDFDGNAFLDSTMIEPCIPEHGTLLWLHDSKPN